MVFDSSPSTPSRRSDSFVVETRRPSTYIWSKAREAIRAAAPHAQDMISTGSMYFRIGGESGVPCRRIPERGN